MNFTALLAEARSLFRTEERQQSWPHDEPLPSEAEIQSRLQRARANRAQRLEIRNSGGILDVEEILGH